MAIADELVGKDLRGVRSLQVSGRTRLDGGLIAPGPSVIAGVTINENIPRGRVGANKIIVSSGFFTVLADVPGLSLSVASSGGRLLRIWFEGRIQSTGLNDRIHVEITDGNNNSLQTGQTVVVDTGAAITLCFFALDSPPAGVVTYKIRAQRDNGAGNCSFFASLNNPCYITAEDYGVA